jgi:hypothetical protein
MSLSLSLSFSLSLSLSLSLSRSRSRSLTCKSNLLVPLRPVLRLPLEVEADMIVVAVVAMELACTAKARQLEHEHDREPKAEAQPERLELPLDRRRTKEGSALARPRGPSRPHTLKKSSAWQRCKPNWNKLLAAPLGGLQEEAGLLQAHQRHQARRWAQCCSTSSL